MALLVALVFFIYGVVGMQVYGRGRRGEGR